jgi:hypothetical protein
VLSTSNRRRISSEEISAITYMNISKADAIAHLAKWSDAHTEVRATHRTVSGNFYVVGRIRVLTEASITITGKDCEMLLYFRSTSEYSYEDIRALPTEANKQRVNKYPTVIEIKFANGDRLEILEFFKE